MKYALLGAGCLLLTGLSWQVGAFDEDDLKKLKATNECLKCDLSGADLTDADLTGTDLTDADLTDANLKGAKLVDANLSGVNLVEANLFSADLTDANLSGANLVEANLFLANLFSADLTGANLWDANLTKANLENAILREANLAGAILNGANLAKANLAKANLAKANLAKANLTKANLTKAILNRAILNGAKLTDANLTDANLTKANLTAAKFCNTKMPDGTINNSGCDSVAKKDAPKPTRSVGVTWCLDSQTIELTNKVECQTRGGLTFASKFLAEKACKECKDKRLTTSKEMVWCATESDVSYVSEKECDEKNGVGNTVKSYAEAMHRGFKRDATKKDDLKKLKATNECLKCDLEGANLKGENLKEAILTGANLAGANLTDASLYKANLEGANLTKAELFAAPLIWANLIGANLTDANLDSALLIGANLTGANLTGANLTGANLTGANLTGANLRSANLKEAILKAAILKEANLTGADLIGADLSASFLRKANLTDANLTGADLTKVKLTSAKFCNTKMPSGTINNSGCDSITKKDAPKPAPTPASSGKTWCGMHDSTEYLKVSDCFSRNGIPTASRSQAGRLKNDYFAKKNHKAFAKASDTATWISQSFNTLEAKEGALTHCHGVSKQPSTCRIVNVNGQYVDEAPAPVPDALNVSSDHRLTDLVGRYSMIHKDLKAYDGYITLKVSGGAVIAEMELCYEFSTCAKFKQTKPPEKVGRLVELAFKKVSGPGFMWDEVQAHITFSADVTTYTGRIGGYRIVGKRQGQGTPTQAVPKDKDSDDPEESSNQ